MDSLASPDLANILRLLAWPLVLVTVLLSLVLAVVLRTRYVAAVIRLQGRSEAVEDGPDVAQQPVPVLQLVFEELSESVRPSGAREVLRLRRRVLLVEAACDLVFWYTCLFLIVFGPALIATLVHAVRTADTTLLLTVVRIGVTGPFDDLLTRGEWTNLLFFGLYLLGPPAVVCLGQTAVNRRYVYLPVVLAAGALLYATARSAFWFEPVMFAGVLGAFAVAITVLQDPRVRGAATPLIVALSLSFVPWTAGVILLGAQIVEAQEAATTASSDLAELVLLAVFLVLMAATCGGILFELARRYERKRFSNIELGRVAFWLLAVLAAFGFGSVTNTGGLTGLAQQIGAVVACWFLCRFGCHAGLRRIIRGAPPSLGGLLVLRVFKRPAKSEAFVDRLLSYWRFAAPVYLIAGADLAGASIEPNEFFAFIRRRLRDQFIRNTSEIEGRVSRLDNQRDPDGRFRVSELFCIEGVWRPAVEALIARAGIILLDLREYHPRRAGTRYEMYHLMNMIAPARVLVLVGKDDDAAVTASELRQAWAAMSDTSPNRRLARPEMRVCRLRSGSAGEVGALFARLHAMATACRDSSPG